MLRLCRCGSRVRGGDLPSALSKGISFPAGREGGDLQRHHIPALCTAPSKGELHQLNSRVSILHHAALSHLLPHKMFMEQMLLTAGANPNLQDSLGNTALHWAVPCGNAEVVQVSAP